jgi:ribosomal protein S14
MKNQKYKDQLRRKNFSNKELQVMVVKGSSFLKNSTLKGKLLRNRKYNKDRVVNRCIVTYRDRSVIRKYQMTRGVLRTLLSYSRIPGLKKSSW